MPTRCLAFWARGVGLTLLGAAPGQSHAQAPQAIDGGATCGECRVVLEPLATLDGRAGDFVGEPLALARTSDGRWLLSTIHAPDRIVTFDPDGTPRRAVGRRGEGPGEYQFIKFLWVGPGDTVRVVDTTLSRITTLGPYLRLVDSRQAAIGFATSLVMLPDGRTMTAQDMRTLGEVGLPMHLVDREGRVERSFGLEDPEAGPDERHDVRARHMAVDPDGSHVWAAHQVRYRIERWSLAGERTADLAREVDWFPPSDDYGMDFSDVDSPPNPGIVSLDVDDAGRLWVPVHVPDPEWEKGLGNVRRLYGRTSTGIASLERYYDTVIEVLDPDTRTVLASHRFDEHLTLVPGTGLAYSYREDDNGFPSIRTWRLSLEDPREDGGRR